MASLASLVASLSLETAAYERGWDRAISATRQSTAEIARQTRQIERGFTEVERQLDRVTRVVDVAKVAFAALGGAFIIRDIIQTATAFEGIENALQAVFGSSRQAAQEFDFISETADKLGLNLQRAAADYTQLAAAAQGTALAGEETRQIFAAVSGAMTVLGRDAEQTSGALTAIQQIISKGTVSAEELRGQLGERLAGAFTRAAEAIGVTTQELDELLRAGALSAQEFLPAFRREINETFGEGFARAAQSAQAQLNRFSTTIQELKLEVARSGLLDGILQGLNDLRDALRSPEMRAAARDLGERLGQGFRLAGEAIALASQHFSALAAAAGAFISFRVAEAVFTLAISFGRLAVAIGSAQGAMLAFNTVSRANVFAAGISAAVAAAIYFNDSIIEIGNTQVRVGRVIEAVWAAVSGSVTTAATALFNAFSGVARVVTLIPRAMFEVVTSTGEAVKALTSFDFSGFQRGMESAFSGGAERIRGDLEEIKQDFAEVGQAAAEHLTVGFDEAQRLLSDLETETFVQINVEEATRKLAQLRSSAGETVDLFAQSQELIAGVFAAPAGGAGGTDFSGITKQADVLEQRMLAIAAATETARAQLDALPTVGFELGRIDDIAAARDAMLQWAEANELTAASFAEIEAAAGVTLQNLAQQIGEQRALQIEVSAGLDLAALQQQQELLLSFAGKESEEYRVQLQLLELKQQANARVASSLEGQVRAVEAANTALEAQAAVNSIAEQADALEMQLQFMGSGSEELRVQIALREELVRLQLEEGTAAAGVVEAEIRRREQLQTLLDRRAASQDLSEQIQQQRLIAQFGGQETAEYRTQVQMLELKKRLNGEITPEMERQVRTLQQLTQQNEAAQEFNSLFDTEVMKNTIRGVQSALTDFFATTLRDGVANWQDLWNSFKDLAIRTIAEVAAQMVFKPIVQFLIGGTAGLGGLGGLDPLAGGGAGGQLSLALGGLTNSLDDFASRIGLAGGAYNQTGLFGTAPFSQTLGVGALGFLGGGSFANLLGLNQTGGGLGGGLGAALAFGLTGGNPLAALLGGGLGSILGGGFGSLFGDDEFNPRVTIGTGGRPGRFEPGVRPVEGPFGLVAPLDIGTHETSAELDQQIAQMVVEFDKAIAGILTDRQQKAVTRLLEGSSSSEFHFNDFQLGEEGFQILQERLRGIFEKLIPDTARPDAFDRVFGDLQPDEDNPQVVQQLTERAQAVIEFLNAFKAFEKGKIPEPPSELATRLAEISARFEEMRGIAKDLGLDLAVLRRAERQEVRAVRQEVVGNLQVLGGESTLGRELEQQFAQLTATLEDVANNLGELGLDPDRFAKLEQGAIKNFRGDVKDQAREISGLGASTSGIDQFTDRLMQLNELFEFMADNLEALGMDKEDFRDFKQKNKQALREGFIGQLESFGPQDTSAAAEFAAALRQIKETFRDAARAAEEFGVSQRRVDKLEKEARKALKIDIKQDIRQISGIDEIEGALGGILEQGKAMNELIDFLSENLKQFKIDPKDFKQFRRQNRGAFKENLFEELEEFATGGETNPFLERLKEIEDTFRTVRESADEFNLSLGRIDRLQREATAALREDLLDSLREFAGLGGEFSGLVDVAERMREQFAFARENAARFGLSLEQIGRLERQAEENIREQFLDQLRSFSEGSGGSPIDQFIRQMEEIDEVFREAAERAREFGVSQDQVQRLRRDAVEQAEEDLIGNLTGLIGETSDPLERLRNQFRDIVTVFDEARAVAARYGVSLRDLNDLQRRALDVLAEDVLGRLEDDLKNQAEAIGGLFDQFIDPLENLQRDLQLGGGGALAPRLQFENARDLFRETLTRAEGGDVGALRDLDAAARAFLEAARAGGSGVFAEAFQEVQAILPDLLRQLQEQRDEAMAGLPDVNRNLEELVREQRQQAQETIDLLREIRNFLREQGRSVADGSSVRRVGR